MGSGSLWGSLDPPMVLFTELGLQRRGRQAEQSSKPVAPLFREIAARLATARTRTLCEPKSR